MQLKEAERMRAARPGRALTMGPEDAEMRAHADGR